MKRMTMATALTVAAVATPVWAQTPGEHDSHHRFGGAESAPAASEKPPAAAGRQGMNMPQGGMDMMGMMSDMKGMMGNMSMMSTMGMMRTMGMTGPGAGGMATIDRVEGRIAFLRTELKITDAQATAWTGFADALRANANKLGEVRASMMSKSGGGQPQTSTTMADRLELQEQWLLARLEGTRTMKSAFNRLNEVLSDEQKKTANDLLVPQMGMGMTAMMTSQMQPGQMQPGQMGSGGMRPGQMGPGGMQPGQMQPPRK